VKLNAVLRSIRRAPSEGRVEVTAHAAEEAANEGAFLADILHVLEHAEDAVAQDHEGRKWKVYGCTLDQTPLAEVVVLVEEALVRVITVHPPH
jgi:hypothetical protein